MKKSNYNKNLPKTWKAQLMEWELGRELFGFLLSTDSKGVICKTLTYFQPEDINTKYGVYSDDVIPTLIKL